MKTIDQEWHDFEIVAQDVNEVIAWARENIPGRVTNVSAYTLPDQRHRVRLYVRGGGQATALKLVFDSGK